MDIKLDARNLIEADVKSALTDLDWFGKERDTGPGKAKDGWWAAEPIGAVDELMRCKYIGACQNLGLYN